MMVPRQRLVWLAALCGVPLFALMGFGPKFAAIGASGLALLAGVAFFDAFRSRRFLEGLKVLLPGQIRVFKGRSADVDLTVELEQPEIRMIRIGLNLPTSIVTDKEDFWVELPAGVSRSTVKWACKPTERGSFRIPSVHCEVSSSFGLWAMRQTQKTNVDVRVYPDLLEERKRVAMLFAHRAGFGIHTQRQVGKGRDFEKLRDYQHGDPLQDVHWKATAKRGRPVTKTFQIERTQEVYVVIDCSRLAARPSHDPRSEPTGQIESKTTVLDRFLTAGLLLALATEQQGDLFGLITFSDKVHQVLRAKSGEAHFALCRDSIYDLQPRLVTPDFDELFSTIRVRLRKRALVLFLTALDDPLVAESFTRGLELVYRQHLVLVNMVEPGGTHPLFDRHSPMPRNNRELYQALGGHMAWQNLRQIQKLLEVRGVKFNVISNELLARELVAQYLEVKQRQIL